MCATSFLTISIRPVIRADAAQWEALRCALWPGDDAGHAAEIAAYFEGTLPEPEIVLLAETLAGVTLSKVVGVAELSVRSHLEGLAKGPIGYVEGLYVIPTARNLGVAKKLLEASREWAKQRGCRAFASDRADRVVVDRGSRPSPADHRRE